MFFDWLFRQLLAPEGEGGGSGGGSGGEGAGAGGEGGGNEGAGEGGSAGSLAEAAKAATAAPEGGAGEGGSHVDLPPWAPQGLPAHMLGQNETDTLDKVFKAFQGFQKESSERGAVPEDASAYTFEESEAIAPFAKDFQGDPVYEDLQKAAQEAGITDKQFAKFLPRVLEGWLGIDGLDLAKPVDFSAEVLKLVPDTAKGADEAGQRNAAGRRIEDALAWVDGVKAQSGFHADAAQNEAIADYLVAQLGDDARGIQAIEFIRDRTRKTGPALGGEGGGGVTDAELDARLTDPRYDSRSPQYNKAFAAETDRLFQERYGHKRVA